MSESILIPLGSVFGRLTVVGPEEGPNKDSRADKCECSCGVTARPYRKKDLKSGRITSCGCMRKEKCSARMTALNTTHGMRTSREYSCWSMIVQRTCNPNNQDYPEYGAKGILISEEFKDFATFLEHIGPCPNDCRTVDRIKNELGYERGNVRWADYFTQANNRRNNVRLSFKGENKTYAEWDRELNFARGTVRQRLHMGWTLEQAITTPRGQVGNRFYRINPIE